MSNVMVFDFSDCGEGDLDNVPVCAFHFYAGCGESLRCFHAANYSAHAPAVGRNDLDVALAV